LDACTTAGPQVVTKRGQETAVLVPIDEWRSLQQRAQPTLKDLLLAPEPRFDLPDTTAWRQSLTLRQPPSFDD